MGLLAGLSLGELDGFLAFEVVRGTVFLPTEPVAALFIAFALDTAVNDCVVR